MLLAAAGMLSSDLKSQNSQSSDCKVNSYARGGGLKTLILKDFDRATRHVTMRPIFEERHPIMAAGHQSCFVFLSSPLLCPLF